MSVAEGKGTVINLPPRRGSPVEVARQPFTSQLIEDEYHQVMAFHNYMSIHQLSEVDPAFKETFDVETWRQVQEIFQRNADIHRFEDEWTPRHGNQRTRFRWRDPSLEEPEEVVKDPAEEWREKLAHIWRHGFVRPRTRPKPNTSIELPMTDFDQRGLLVGPAPPKLPPERKERRAAMEAKIELKKLRLQAVLNAPDARSRDGECSLEREVEGPGWVD